MLLCPACSSAGALGAVEANSQENRAWRYRSSGVRPRNSGHVGYAAERVAQCCSQRVFLLWCTLAGLGRSSSRAGRSCFGRRDSEGERQQKQQRTLRCGLEQHAQ